ncbi:MAG: hypothetical protein QNJ51_09055 [Calothrix sp. MO_167.B12]|nr:hypothetical protein [Calothrix sp. MO_167.B12]
MAPEVIAAIIAAFASITAAFIQSRNTERSNRTTNIKQSDRFYTSINTSGQGKNSIVPDEVKGWNWAAFLIGFIWAIGNNVWIGLLCLVPYFGVVMFFVLGFKGNEWAWRSRRWESVKAFRNNQRTWTITAVIIDVLFITLVIVTSVPK